MPHTQASNPDPLYPQDVPGNGAHGRSARLESLLAGLQSAVPIQGKSPRRLALRLFYQAFFILKYFNDIFKEKSVYQNNDSNDNAERGDKIF